MVNIDLLIISTAADITVAGHVVHWSFFLHSVQTKAKDIFYCPVIIVA
jgi:hypothetical protein